MKVTAGSKEPMRGMTLMEVVIAIGVIAFAIPLILAATGSASGARAKAEADTRSAWLSRGVQQQVFAKWAVPTRKSDISSDLPFPVFQTKETPLILLYDADGNFLAEGDASDINGPSKTSRAAYLVALYGEAHNPPGVAAGTFSLISMSVLYPAKAIPANRSTFHYDLISTRNGNL